MSYANVRRGRLRKHLRWLPVTLAHATLPHRSCVSKGGPKGPPALLHAKSTRRSVWRRSFSCSLEQHQCRPSCRTSPHTTHSPAACRCRRSSGRLDHRASALKSHASAAFRAPTAAYPRSVARRCASFRQPACRLCSSATNGCPQISHGRLWIGSVRWFFAWRKTADSLRPQDAATWRYDVPAASASSTAAACGCVQTVQTLDISIRYHQNQPKRDDQPFCHVQTWLPPLLHSPPSAILRLGGGPTPSGTAHPA